MKGTEMTISSVQWMNTHPSKTEGWTAGEEQLVVARLLSGQVWQETGLPAPGSEYISAIMVGYVDQKGNIHLYTNGASIVQYDEIEADDIITADRMYTVDRYGMTFQYEWAMM